MVAILVVLTIVLAVGLDAFILSRRRARHPAPAVVRAMAEPHPPQDVFLDEGHAWLRMAADGVLRVGVDEFLTEALGDVEKVEVPERGTAVRRGEPLVRLRVKGRTLAVPAPADGEVMRVNQEVAGKPWLLTRDPYGAGWVVGLWTRDHQEAIRGLRVGASVAGFLRRELQHLADFLTPAAPAGATVLADGGVPTHGAVAGLDDEAWARFESEFLTARRER